MMILKVKIIMRDEKMPIIYPFPNEISLLIDLNYSGGNFGLWFNKFIPLLLNEEKNKKLHPCNKNGEKKPVDYYENFYSSKIKNAESVKSLLSNKHYSQVSFYKSFEKKYEAIIITAELISSLITGIGLTHPNEVGMTFDHTIGIPYIPASTIKGIVRFAHLLELSQNIPNKESNFFDEESEWTNVLEMFGRGGDSEPAIGRVIFLDAYPETVPEIVADIMNPHYAEYYSKGKAPGDYLNPTPIKFLTVKKGTKFIFRILVNKDKSYYDLKNNKNLKDLVLKAVKKSLEEEGIGAKTAVGYGLFTIKEFKEPESIENYISEENRLKDEEQKKIQKEKEKEKFNNMSEIEKIIYGLKNNYEEKNSMDVYRNIFESNGDAYNKEDQIKIAGALKDAWIKHEKWDHKKASKKQKEKINKIKNILGEA